MDSFLGGTRKESIAPNLFLLCQLHQYNHHCPRTLAIGFACHTLRRITFPLNTTATEDSAKIPRLRFITISTRRNSVDMFWSIWTSSFTAFGCTILAVYVRNVQCYFPVLATFRRVRIGFSRGCRG